MVYADIGQGACTTAGSMAFLTVLLGMTRQSGGSTLAFTRTMLGLGVVAAIGAVPSAAWLVREILRQRRKGNSRPS